jgi:glyoxylase-like metal-dependent hydrolase (beta-lactamase superfamily II)
MVVVSHHHYDHGGGLAHFLDANQWAKVFLRQCEERELYFGAFGLSGAQRIHDCTKVIVNGAVAHLTATAGIGTEVAG